ncbi:MAG: acetyl ornithine aminotransferase family protein [Bryobacterales bacterium]|nr:acetyl ornithine aminotransferase family protein [Bryobacteraceae bacterium]MDW8130158.1 acetyl ornithine aminotransferase family protein [Bryobacterales bacterium]
MQPAREGSDSQLPRIVTELPGPRARALIERDHAVLSPSYTRPYPLAVEQARGAIVEDVDGNRFLDFNAGIAVVATGHCHPRVVEAIRGQAEKLIHMSGTDFYYPNMVELAEKLAALAPGDMPRRLFFCNSGAEAIEAALKLARFYSGRSQFVAFLGCFHGRTLGALSLTSSRAVQRRGFGPLLAGVHHVPYPDCYRCPYGQQEATCRLECVSAIEERFRTVAPAEEVAAIVIEPVLGEGGYVVPPAKFFEALQQLARRHGVLIVADEVQSGMGRTGRMWASEHFGLVPDLMAVAKGIASGLPLGAMIARAEIMNWPPGAHASTFGGNPVAVAAALVTLELLQQELIANAARLGAYMLERMREWPSRYRCVGQVRGLGLMIGIEIVREQASRERAPELRDRIVQMAFERGLLILGAGPSALRLSPPLVITREQADFALDTLEECLEQTNRAS